jgi:hypothetical protein
MLDGVARRVSGDEELLDLHGTVALDVYIDNSSHNRDIYAIRLWISDINFHGVVVPKMAVPSTSVKARL